MNACVRGPLQLPIATPRDEVAETCDRCQVAELAMFGSILTPAFGPDSDVDFLVTSKPGATIGLEFFDLKAELEALAGRLVDIVTRLSLRKILACIGLPARAPPVAPARAREQAELAFEG